MTLTPLSRDAVFRQFRKEKRQFLNAHIPSFRNVRVPETFNHIEIEASFGDFIKISLDRKTVILLKWKPPKTRVQKFINGELQSVFVSGLSPRQLMQSFVVRKLNKSGNLIKHLEGSGWLVEVLNQLKPVAIIESLRIVDKGGNDMFWMERCYGTEEKNEDESGEDNEHPEIEYQYADEEDYEFDNSMLPSCSLNPGVLCRFKKLQKLQYYSETLAVPVLKDIKNLNLRELRLGVSSSSFSNGALHLNSQIFHFWERKNSFNVFKAFAKKLTTGSFDSGSGYGLCETDDMSTDQFFDRIQLEFPGAQKQTEEDHWNPVKGKEAMVFRLSETSGLFFFVFGGYRVELFNL